MELKKYIGKAIKHFRISRGMNQEQLAELLETTKQTVSRYESGERQANQDVLFKLSNVFNVSIDDFFPTRETLVNEERSEYNVRTNQYAYLPTTISAGLPIEVDGVTNADKISIPDALMGKWAGDKKIFFSRINGDSMDKIMPDKSLIAIKPIDKESLKNGDIAVFSHNHEYSVKYFYKTTDKLIFKPSSTNEAHHEQHFDINDGVEIHGKVVAYIVELD